MAYSPLFLQVLVPFFNVFHQICQYHVDGAEINIARLLQVVANFLVTEVSPVLCVNIAFSCFILQKIVRTIDQST